MTVTIEELDDVSIDDEVPCELLWDGKMCGKPAVARAKAHCVIHGWGTVWMCEYCRKLIRLAGLTHNGCRIFMEVEWL